MARARHEGEDNANHRGTRQGASSRVGGGVTHHRPRPSPAPMAATDSDSELIRPARGTCSGSTDVRGTGALRDGMAASGISSSPYSATMNPGPAPRLFVNGAPSAELTGNLDSLSVHVVEGRATAEVVLVSPVHDAPSTRADIEQTSLAIRLSVDETCFSGRLTGIEARMSDAGHRTVLFADGTSPDGGALARIPLRFGAEVEAVSVRHGTHTSTAHGVSTALGLRWNSRLSLTTVDPAFDGLFRVVELWYRFDTSRGVQVEFIATG